MEQADEQVSSDRIIRFVQDEPTEVDFFETHSRLASAIASALDENRHTRIVGLLGKWGSGKSTVVRLLAKELNKVASGKNVHVFTYDAWLHQHDPVRRSFLESLYSFLLSRDHVQKSEWGDKIEMMKGTRESSNITSTPRFTAGGRLITLSLLLLPIAIALLGLDTVKEAFGQTWTRAGFATFWVSFGILAAPAVLFAHRWAKARDSEESDQVLSLFMNKSVETTVSKTSRDPEPTAIEFRKIFQGIMESATKQERRYVFVIDNLDRIDPSEALQMWATIRSFFFIASDDRPESCKLPYQPVVVLPIDRHSLKRLFESGGEENSRLLDSFIDKTFDLLFEIPPPVMSDWRAYLADKFCYALNLPAQAREVYWMRRFYEDWIGSDNSTTPRQLNRLVNRVVSLALQWRGVDISIETMCFYAVHASHIETIGILPFITEEPVSAVPAVKNWQLELVALHFGVDREKAAQVLLRDPITEAIRAQDNAAFARLIQVPGFPEVFEKLIDEAGEALEGKGAGFAYITSVAILLQENASLSGIWVDLIWDSLARLMIASDDDTAAIPDFGDRTRVFYNHLSARVRGEFFDRCADKIAVQFAQVLTAAQLDSLGQAATELSEQAARAALPTPKFGFDGNPARFLARVARFVRANSALWQQFRWKGGIDDLVEALAASFSAANGGLNVPLLIGVLASEVASNMLESQEEIDWAPLIEVLEPAARQPSADPPSSVYALEALAVLNRTEDVTSALSALVDEGHVASRISEALTQNKWAEAARLTAILIWREADFASPAAPWLEITRAYPGYIQETYEALTRYSDEEAAGLLWSAYAEAPTSREFVRSVIEYTVANDLTGFTEAATVLNNLETFLKPLASPQRHKFILDLAGRHDFWGSLGSLESDAVFGQAIAPLVSRKSPVAAKALAQWQHRLEQKAVAVWPKAITSGVEPFPLAVALRDRIGGAFDKETTLFAGLSGFLSSVLAASFDARRRWFGLVRLLAPAAQKTVLRDLGAKILRGEIIRDLASLMSLSGDLLIDSAVFRDAPDDAVQKLIIPLSQTKDGQAWIESFHAEVKVWVQKSRKGTRNSLEARLRTMSQYKRAEHRYWAELMRSRLL